MGLCMQGARGLPVVVLQVRLCQCVLSHDAGCSMTIIGPSEFPDNKLIPEGSSSGCWVSTIHTTSLTFVLVDPPLLQMWQFTHTHTHVDLLEKTSRNGQISEANHIWGRQHQPSGCTGKPSMLAARIVNGSPAAKSSDFSGKLRDKDDGCARWCPVHQSSVRCRITMNYFLFFYKYI